MRNKREEEGKIEKEEGQRKNGDMDDKWEKQRVESLDAGVREAAQEED
jgi:hypothetical protein